MSYKPGWRAGRWSAICDVCGFRFHSDEMRQRWDGLYVCNKDFETRHIADFIRAKKETIVPPWTAPEEEDVFIEVCYLWEISAYADLASADCATADTATHSYVFLRDLKAG